MHLTAGSGVQPWIPTGLCSPSGLLSIDYIRAYRSQANEFMWQWGDGSGHVGSSSTSDRFVSGTFEGIGKAQLLAISTSESAEMMDFNGSSWVTSWSTKFGLPNWIAQAGDKYIVGDFAGLADRTRWPSTTMMAGRN